MLRGLKPLRLRHAADRPPRFRVTTPSAIRGGPGSVLDDGNDVDGTEHGEPGRAGDGITGIQGET